MPPVLNLGWIIDTKAMLDYAQEHDIESEVFGNEVSFDTCIDTLGAMVDHNGLPDDDRIQIIFVSDGDYDPNAHALGKNNLRIGVRAGMNYDGHIADEHIDLGSLVAPGVKPQWFLDRDRWQWTRVKSGASPLQMTTIPAPFLELSVTSYSARYFCSRAITLC